MIDVYEKFSFINEKYKVFFVLDQNKVPDSLVILRVLAGSLKLQEEGMDDKIDLVENFIKPGENITQKNFSNLFGYLNEDSSENVEIISILEHKKFSERNKKFYKMLKSEIISSVFSYEKSNYISSFLYLYRAIEYISTACVLIYASQEKQFEKAYIFFKTMYANEKNPNEFHILKKFLKFFYKESSMVFPETISFDMKKIEDCFSEEIVNVWREFIKPEVIKYFADSQNGNKIFIDYDRGIVDFPFVEIISLIVFIRNKSFHYQIGTKNLQLPIIGGERLFKILMPGFLEWFSNLFIEILKWEIKAT